MKDFVHLHLHTQYSLLDGAIKVKDLASKAIDYGYSAVAITDHGNLFGIVDFYKSMKSAGIKPIIGMEAYFTTGSRFDRKGKASEDNITDKQNHHLILIAKDDEGLRNLMKLSTLSYKEGFYYKPRIDYELLSQYHKGLVAITACLKGVPTYYASIGEEGKAEEWVKKFLDLFGDDLYLELQSNSLPEQEVANRTLIDIAKRLGVKLVATNDSHYLLPEDRLAHQVLMAIQMKKTLMEVQQGGGLKCVNEGLHFARPEEVWEKFKDKFDGWERALLNTLEVAEKTAGSFSLLEGGGYLMPHFPTDGMPLQEFLKELAIKGLRQRIEQGIAKDSKEYWDRLFYELDVVSRMGFEGYFLIVQDFINWAKSQGIPVGPGRGSAAGSLLAFSLGITDVDPIRHGLLFERFLNPERVSMPDIDVDFCMENRDKVIEYVRGKYGSSNVAQIITYNVMKAKQTLRDVARALGIPYQTADSLAKLIPQGDVQGTWLSLEEMFLVPIEELLNKYGKHRTDIEENATRFRRLCENDPELKKLVEIALRLEGLTRHTSLHAAGVVIAPNALEELLPLYYDKDGGVATQFDMVKLEELGFIKMDFLGLKTLTELQKTRNLIKERHGVEINYLSLPLDDIAVYNLLREGNTTGVFQLESAGMKRLLVKLQPDSFDDIVAVLALYRPGPLKSGLVDSYINRKHGKESVEYPFPELEPVLKETYGVWVYQEQIMKASQVLAGFTPGEADTLRKAIGKKKADLMAKMKEKFISGAVERGYDEAKIRELWEDIEKFASYSFNKSHSVAYGYLSYWTAYLKAHYPEEFFCVKLSTEKNDKKFINLLKDAKNEGFRLLPPDINKSGVDFIIEDEKTIRFGLARIKGVGEETARHIIDSRKRPWTSLGDFVRSVDSKKVNKKTLEALIKAGAFDFMGEDRSRLLQKLENGSSIFMKGLFGQKEENIQEDLSKYEKEVLGFYISSHPLDPYEKLLKGKVSTIDLLEEAQSGTYTLAGVITDLKVKKTQKGNRLAVFNLVDKTGIQEVIVFPDIYEQNADKIKEDQVIVGKFDLDVDEETEETKLLLREVYTTEEFFKEQTGNIRLVFTKEIEEESIKTLRNIIEQYTREDGKELILDLRINGYRTLLHADPRIKLSSDVLRLRDKLKEFGVIVEVL
ncbi:MAG: DNA polymerase III subunit alpha [Aquificaceae bacterium]|nr:DNA polymerase III subunit alpha [Aquificaceae bacterium]MDW8423528.1 DNA polymerase III subunit alpha [Aquificaceae bacterium]